METVTRALASGGYQGERHGVGLALSGAMLGLGAAREQVPAIVRACTAGAGWDGEHHWSGAVDTVARYSEGYAVKGLSALPIPVREALEFAFGVRRAQEAARPPAPRPTADSLEETTRKLTEVIRSAPVGVTTIKAQCGLGKTHAARAVAVERASRTGKKRNYRTSIAVPTTALAVQVTNDLRAAGVAVTRLFGPLSVPGPFDGYECQIRPQAAALARGGYSVRALYCGTCERESTCAATTGQDEQEGARVTVGPHALLAELVEAAGSEGLVFVDEPPAADDDEVFTIDALIAAERALAERRFEEGYTTVMRSVLRTVRSWVEVAPHEQAGSVGRAWNDPGDFAAVRAAVAALPTVPPLDRQSVIASRMVLGLATRLGAAAEVLRAVVRAVVREGVSVTVYDRGEGVTMAVTGLDRDVEALLLGANRAGEAQDRRVVLAGADVDLHVERYRALAPHLDAYDFAAPDGARIERTMIVLDGSRARLATKDHRPIESAARLVVEWAMEARDVATVGVVTFKSAAAIVRRYLETTAPTIRWEVAHYGAMRGLDRWKDFDAVATVGDPRPNLDAVSRELGGGGEEVEGRYDRANDRARAELEQAHGRLRTVHRRRPGRALHVGRLLPGGWVDDPADPDRRVAFRRPPSGRVPRPVVEGLEQLVADAGGPRAVARMLGRSPGTVGGWLRGEGRPDAAAVEALRRAGTERRQADRGASDRKRPLRIPKGHSRSVDVERSAPPVQVYVDPESRVPPSSTTRPRRIRIPDLPGRIEPVTAPVRRLRIPKPPRSDAA